jgi:hypothetical protein
MHAVVVEVTINDFETGRAFLRDEVVPRVKGAPGFVAGYWVRVGENAGRSVIVFESEEAARKVAEQVTSAPNPGVTLNSVDVGEVVEHA